MNRICFVDDVGTLCFLPEKDYAKKENWDVIRQSVVDRYSDPTKGYAVSKAAYEAGERTPDAIANYITALVSAKELTALQGDSLATTYLDGWDDAKFCDASSWPLLEAAVVNPQGKAFSRLLKLQTD